MIKFYFYFFIFFSCAAGISFNGAGASDNLDPNDTVTKRLQVAFQNAEDGHIDFVHNLLDPIPNSFDLERKAILSLASIQCHLMNGALDHAKVIYGELSTESKKALYKIERSLDQNPFQSKEMVLLFKYGFYEEWNRLNVSNKSIAYYLNWGDHHFNHGEWKKAIQFYFPKWDWDPTYKDYMAQQLAKCHRNLGINDVADYFDNIIPITTKEQTNQRILNARHRIAELEAIIACYENSINLKIVELHMILKAYADATIELFNLRRSLDPDFLKKFILRQTS